MKSLIIKDRIYGKTEIASPVIIELVNSKFLQRLKNICQYGVPDEFYHLKNYSRLEHSLGVMILLKKLGASEEEQIAGLLHDVSHTAFSHVVDWVLGNSKNEDNQDKGHKDFLLNSEIAKIIKKYNFNIQRIAEHHNFKLLEKDIPDLCADRIDYSIREFPSKIAKKCFKSMTVKNDQIVFKNKETAYLFAINFLKRQRIHWGGFEAVARYKFFSQLLKRALEEKIIKKQYFLKDDDFVIKKLKKSKNKEINKILKILKKRSLKNFPAGKEVVRKKFRYVDPKFIQSNKIVRLSKVSREFEEELEKAKKENKKGITVPKI